MEHLTALLLIVGCSPDLTQCHELPAPTAIYEAYDQCEAQRPFALEDMNGKAGRIFATCVFVDPAAEEADAQLDWDITNDGRLDAAVTFPDPSKSDPVLTSSIVGTGNEKGVRLQ